ERGDGGEQGGGQQAEQQVEPDQQHHDDDEAGQARDHEDNAEADEPPDRRQVRGGSREQLTGLPSIVERGFQPLQVLVNLVPHRLLEAGHGRRLCPPPEQVQRYLGDAKADGGQPDRDKQAVAMTWRPGRRGDRTVDRGLGEQRDGNLSTGAEERAREHNENLAVVRTQELPDAPKCRQRSLRPVYPPDTYVTLSIRG